MIEGAGRLRRALGCVAGAALVGVPMWLIATQTLYWFSYTRQEAPLLIALPLCLGLGAALGLDLAAARQSRAVTQRPAWARMLAGSLAIVSLILLGVIGGALVIPLTGMYSAGAVKTEIAVVFIVFGVVAAAMVIGWRVDSPLRAVPLCVALGVLYAGSFVWSDIVTNPRTFQFHCPRGVRCAISPPWQDVLPSFLVQYALPVGIWLGIMLWGALALGRRAAAARLALRAS